MLTDAATVAAIPGRTFDATETARVETLIALTQTAIEGRLGRSAEGQAFTDVAVWAGPYRSNLFLPHFPLVSIEDVTEDEALITAADFHPILHLGVVGRVSGTIAIPWVYTSPIVVSYTTATIDELAILCARIVARAFTAGEQSTTAPSALAGLKQLTIGRWSATKETGKTADPAAALELTAEDLATVDRWRTRRP